MATRLPCEICKSKHRTASRRIAGGKWVILCVSCHAALVKFYEWKRANPGVDVLTFVRLFVEFAPKPVGRLAEPPEEKTG